MLKSFWAGFQGAVIGTIVAISVNPMFWWTGLIVGFVVGWLAYDWQEVFSATKYVFRDWCWKNIPAMFGNLLYFTTLFLVLIMTAFLIFYYPISFFTHKSLLTVFLLEGILGPWYISYFISLIFAVATGIALCVFGTGIFLGLGGINITGVKEITEDPENLPNNYASANWLKKITVCARMLLLPVIAVLGFAFFLLLIIYGIVGMIIIPPCKIIIKVFSEERNAVGFGAMVGVALGYAIHFVQPPILSVIAGGLIGGFTSAIIYQLINLRRERTFGRIWNQ
jgi:uncharacterized membrane protein (Fun14 family)